MPVKEGDVLVPFMKTARVLLETAPTAYLATVKSPKSCASPLVEIVIKSIVFTAVSGYNPSAIKARVGEDTAPALLFAFVKSPKSTAFAVDCIVIKSITF